MSHGCHPLQVIFLHHVCGETLQELLLLLLLLCQTESDLRIDLSSSIGPGWTSPHPVSSCRSPVGGARSGWRPSSPGVASSAPCGASWPCCPASADGSCACSPASRCSSSSGGGMTAGASSSEAGGGQTQQKVTSARGAFQTTRSSFSDSSITRQKLHIFTRLILLHFLH